ncbi:uncharacterized protein LOC112509094 [Cynara cardunculus var. scolymus]|uniref:uncharacterized protein LOC112509094 n=1 Tax=Cynara cardunculus var. scolymus TaxID=59895 RepID=UPI000D62DFAE|nr:uncharacterized protein LOC112509094 [Cynara cardunculus var. scolymus]
MQTIESPFHLFQHVSHKFLSSQLNLRVRVVDEISPYKHPTPESSSSHPQDLIKYSTSSFDGSQGTRILFKSWKHLKTDLCCFFNLNWITHFPYLLQWLSNSDNNLKVPRFIYCWLPFKKEQPNGMKIGINLKTKLLAFFGSA